MSANNQNTEYSLAQKIEMAQRKANPPEQVTHMGGIEEGIRQLLAAQQKTQISLDILTREMQGVKDDLGKVTVLERENHAIKKQLLATQGQVLRLEQREDELSKKLENCELTTKKNDLVFYNLPETVQQNHLQLKAAMYGLFIDAMQVPRQYIFDCKTNPGGEIRIDQAYRIGRYEKDKKRPVVVKFVIVCGKELLMSKAYKDKLKEKMDKVRVSENFPTEMKERRMAQIDTLKSLKETHKDSGEKITLNKDKLVINGKPVRESMFEMNPLKTPTKLMMDCDKMQRSQKYSEKQSVFQGHTVKIYNKDQATAARFSLLQHPTLAQAKHLIYGYKFVKQDGNIESGFSDDGEVGAGQIVMESINQNKSVNVFVCVSRLKEGGNIGKIRFDLVRKCANEVLKMDEEFNDPEDTFTSL